MNRAKLKGLRIEKGYTQAAFADALGMPNSTYALKEQGKSEFTEKEISKIGEVLKVNPSIFFEDKVSQ